MRLIESQFSEAESASVCLAAELKRETALCRRFLGNWGGARWLPDSSYKERALKMSYEACCSRGGRKG